MDGYVIVVLFSTFSLAFCSQAGDTRQPALYGTRPTFPVGDFKNCILNNVSPRRLETLPGSGWDNLRNRVSGMVVFYNYSQCRTSEDGRYLLPDDVFVTPIKESKASLNSELTDHWSNYSSMTSTTINADAHYKSSFGSISGSFSLEYRHVKEHQVEDKAITSRVQLRNRVYAAHLQPDPQLHPKFKTRLLDIGAHLQNENMPVARFLADILVRDYGTHYVTRVDSGGILAKMDHISKSYVATQEKTRLEIQTSASASFFETFGASGSVSHLNKHTVSDSYKKNVMDSQVFTYGGPPVRENFSIGYWEDNLASNLVAIDREGDPLHFIITPETLPELEEETTFKLSSLVLKSLQLYYKNNAITGCTDADSPNFNFQANLDDHSCKAIQTNFTFGGVYQTCQPTGSPPSDPCVGYRQKNPKTHGYSCPSGYTPIRLHDGKLAVHCVRHCHGLWIFKSCHTQCGGGKYSTFWCAAEGSVPQESGYLFGGLYSDTTNNVITKAKKCPKKYYPQRFGPKGMYVCISDDYELGAQYSIPFGGFMSCTVGNPLAITSRKGLAKFSMADGPPDMPKHCPPGFSQHLAVIDQDCEITYCTKTNFLKAQGLPNIRRPPFHEKPERNYAVVFPKIIENNDTNKVFIRFDAGEDKWVELTTRMSVNMSRRAKEMQVTGGAVENLKLFMLKLEEPQSSASSSKDDDPSPGIAAGVSVGVTAFVGFVIAAVCVRRRRRVSQPLNVEQSSYHSFT